MKWEINRIRWRTLAVVFAALGLACYGLLGTAWVAVGLVAAALVATVIAHYSPEMTP